VKQQQYQRKSIDLVRSFGPVSESMDHHSGRFIQPGDPRGPVTGAEFKFKSGLRVHLYFAHRMHFSRQMASNWIHFSLIDLGKELGRKINTEPGFCWWKWNLNLSGTPEGIRMDLLTALEIRLERCAQHGACSRLALETATKEATP
jgi:hypothetical protein